MDQQYDLDLYSLDIPSRLIRMPDGSEVKIVAPNLQNIIKLGIVISDWEAKAKKLGVKGTQSAEGLKIVEIIINKIESLIPEVQGKGLSLDNLMKVVQLAMTLVKPVEQQELEKRGITITDVGKGSKKKVPTSHRG